MKNLAKIVVGNSMRKEAEKKLTKLNDKPNNIFTLEKFIKKDTKDIGGRCMIGKDGKVNVSKKTKKEYGKITRRKSRIKKMIGIP